MSDILVCDTKSAYVTFAVHFVAMKTKTIQTCPYEPQWLLCMLVVCVVQIPHIVEITSSTKDRQLATLDV